jgi:hypothetical protein
VFFVPDSFIGGSSSILRSLCLNSVAIVYRFISAETFCVCDRPCSSPSHSSLLFLLSDAPPSPEMMIKYLFSITRLEELAILFRSPRPHSARACLCKPLLTVSLLPGYLPPPRVHHHFKSFHPSLGESSNRHMHWKPFSHFVCPRAVLVRPCGQ